MVRPGGSPTRSCLLEAQFALGTPPAAPTMGSLKFSFSLSIPNDRERSRRQSQVLRTTSGAAVAFGTWRGKLGLQAIAKHQGLCRRRTTKLAQYNLTRGGVSSQGSQLSWLANEPSCQCRPLLLKYIDQYPTWGADQCITQPCNLQCLPN